MKSCITLSLVPSLKGGPWILWDDLDNHINSFFENIKLEELIDKSKRT